MPAHRPLRSTGTAALAVVCTAALLALTGCSDDGSPDSSASKAASAASRAASVAQSVGASVGAEVTAAASSLASQAASAFASATAEVGRQLDEIKGGADVKGDVKLGAPATDGSGRTTVAVTVTNSADSTKSFAVQVDFKKADGTWQDTVVVTVSDVPAGKTGKGTARSTHTLSGDGDVKAEVARAVRY